MRETPSALPPAVSSSVAYEGRQFTTTPPCRQTAVVFTHLIVENRVFSCITARLSSCIPVAHALGDGTPHQTLLLTVQFQSHVVTLGIFSLDILWATSVCVSVVLRL